MALFAFAIGWSLGDIPAEAGLLVGGIGGLTVGTVQWAACRRRLSLTIEWVFASVVGWGIGLAAGFLAVHGLGWAGSAGEAGGTALIERRPVYVATWGASGTVSRVRWRKHGSPGLMRSSGPTL